MKQRLLNLAAPCITMMTAWSAFFCGCTGENRQSSTTAIDPAPANVPFEKYIERIPGSDAKFEMIPIADVLVRSTLTGEGRRDGVRRFWMGKTEVTWDEFRVFVLAEDLKTADEKSRVEGKTRPSKPYARYEQHLYQSGYPVMGVHYEGAVAYCEWLSKLTGKRYRLPTEREWEVACADGGKAIGAEELLESAWLVENTVDERHPVAIEVGAHPVGEKKANTFGLHDMVGNVAEWVMMEAGMGRPVTKGGSYLHSVKVMAGGACGFREELSPKWQRKDPEDPKSKWWLSDGPHVGFRVVRAD